MSEFEEMSSKLTTAFQDFKDKTRPEDQPLPTTSAESQDTLKFHSKGGKKMLEVSTATGAKLLIELPEHVQEVEVMSGWLVKDERQ